MSGDQQGQGEQPDKEPDKQAAPRPTTTPPEAQAAQAADPSFPLMGVRVLLVEDNPVNRVLALATLVQWGMTVTLAEDGEEAVQAVADTEAAGHPFQLVLMDLQMPRMDGLEATRVLRRTHSASQLPILAVTASVLETDREAAMAAGMNAYLAKPINRPQLQQWLVQLLKGQAGSAP